MTVLHWCKRTTDVTRQNSMFVCQRMFALVCVCVCVCVWVCDCACALLAWAENTHWGNPSIDLERDFILSCMYMLMCVSVCVWVCVCVSLAACWCLWVFTVHMCVCVLCVYVCSVCVCICSLCVCVRVWAPARLESRDSTVDSPIRLFNQILQPNLSHAFTVAFRATRKASGKRGQEKPLTLGSPDPTGRHSVHSLSPSFLYFSPSLSVLTWTTSLFNWFPFFLSLLLLLSKPTVRRHTHSACTHTHFEWRHAFSLMIDRYYWQRRPHISWQKQPD